MNNTLCGSETPGSFGAPARNRYFYGKLMDAFHFELEQGYLNRKRWLLNQLAVGHGVLCGLQVAATTDGSRIVVGPGVALAGDGREIVVPEATQPVNLRQPLDDCGRPDGDPIAGAEIVHVCLAYHECEAEPVPVYTGDCESRSACAASLIRERYRIIVRRGRAPRIEPACGFQQPFAAPPPGEASPLYAMLVDRISRPCADRAGDPCVVLAQIALPADGMAITEDMIDPTLRPVVYSNELLLELLLCLAQQQPQQQEPAPANPPEPELTRVTDLSWAHDGAMPFSKFISDGLKVTFSEPVGARPRRDEAWFIVSVEYPILLRAEDTPAQLLGTIFVHRVHARDIRVNGNVASFLPDLAFKTAFEAIIGAAGPDAQPLCRVVLNCNALAGADELPVDGDFLLGKLPSGDGTPGGVFESWFTLDRR